MRKNLDVTTKYGFFGLNELHFFFKEEIEPIFNNSNNTVIVLDFSSVFYWDLSALLWLLVALDYYLTENVNEQKGNTFKLILPEPSDNTIPIEEMEEDDQNRLKSIDYLRRWKFFNALRNITQNPEEFFLEGQEELINCDPQYFFKKDTRNIDGLYKELISINLLEISNLVNLSLKKEKRTISKNEILRCLEEYIDKAICPIISNRCGIKKEIANMFVTHLLYESLINSLQHPNANMGMFSISKISTNKLLLTIVDNGEPIPETIYKHFRNTYKDIKKANLPESYNHRKLSDILRAKIISHATKRGVSRKMYFEDQDWEDIYLDSDIKPSKVGVGLTHIRDATTKDFNGNLIVAAAGVSVKFETPSDQTVEPKYKNFDFPWPGNLLRIQIPIQTK